MLVNKFIMRIQTVFDKTQVWRRKSKFWYIWELLLRPTYVPKLIIIHDISITLGILILKSSCHLESKTHFCGTTYFYPI